MSRKTWFHAWLKLLVCICYLLGCDKWRIYDLENVVTIIENIQCYLFQLDWRRDHTEPSILKMNIVWHCYHSSLQLHDCTTLLCGCDVLHMYDGWHAICHLMHNLSILSYIMLYITWHMAHHILCCVKLILLIYKRS